jgi:hypothetical protein
MLRALAVLFTVIIFGVCFGELLGSIASLRAGNVGNEPSLGVSYVFLTLKFIVDALPYAFDVLVVFASNKLLDELLADRFSEAASASCRRLARLCCRLLAVSVLAGIGFNLLQVLFSGALLTVNASLDIPVFSIAFVLAALLFTRLVEENKRLREDNDMFV